MKLKHRKVTQDFDILVKLLIKNAVFLPNVFTYYLTKQLNYQSFLLH